jgi:hypothetical protein
LHAPSTPTVNGYTRAIQVTAKHLLVFASVRFREVRLDRSRRQTLRLPSVAKARLPASANSIERMYLCDGIAVLVPLQEYSKVHLSALQRGFRDKFSVTS